MTRRVREFLLPEGATAGNATISSIPPLPDSPASGRQEALRAIDLTATLVIVPTRQAARHLSETLVRHAAARGLALLGARIVPPSFLLQPDPPDLRTASPTAVMAAWAGVLLDLGPDELPTLLPPSARRSDFAWALHTGRMIQDLRETLADGSLDIAAVPARAGTALAEPDRWAELGLLESRYLAHLDSQGLRDPCVARRAYAAAPSPPPGITRIVVACVPDPPLLVLDALRQLARTLPVDVLIHAPPDLADTFDAWGRPLIAPWSTRTIPLPEPDTRIVLAATPAHQAEQAVTWLQTFAASHGPGQTAVGVPDREVTPFLAAACRAAGLHTFDPADRPVAAHLLFALLAALTDLVADAAYPAVAALVRHPDMLAALAARRSSPRALLAELDTFQNAFLPSTLEDILDALRRHPAPAAPARDPYTTLRTVLPLLARHLAALRRGPPEPALRTFFQDVYQARQLDPGDPDDVEFETVADKLDRALRELGDAPPLPPLLATSTALHVLRLRLAGDLYHPRPRQAGITLEGWLELPWNDAPGLLITGMNEDRVPAAAASDPFLPDTLLAALDLRHAAARFARDAYLLTAMLEARRSAGTAAFLVGKVSATGDPLKPSRLLFRCADDALAQRAARLFGPAEARRPTMAASVSFKLSSAPPPDAARRLPLQRLSVTAFRDYLACPFRFYLGHVLRMEPLDDAKTGPDALDFGILTHAVLEQMARTGLWACGDEARLRAFMNTETDRQIAGIYGARPPATVLLAAAAAKQRLGAAARCQVALAADGWVIEETERKLEATIDGITIVGKIDRIDRHRATGALRLIDYKTTDSAVDPDAAHLGTVPPQTPDWMVAPSAKPRRWIDLQLPLYVLLLRMTRPDASVTPAYFNLPKAVADTHLAAWEDFTPELLDSARLCLGELLGRIRANRYWPPTERVPYERFETVFTGSAADHFYPPFPEAEAPA